MLSAWHRWDPGRPNTWAPFHSHDFHQALEANCRTRRIHSCYTPISDLRAHRRSRAQDGYGRPRLGQGTAWRGSQAPRGTIQPSRGLPGAGGPELCFPVTHPPNTHTPGRGTEGRAWLLLIPRRNPQLFRLTGHVNLERSASPRALPVQGE